MFTKVRVITCASNDAKAAQKHFVEVFGQKPTKQLSLPNLGFNNAIVDIGGIPLEFIEPINAQEKPIHNFLKKRGPGLYLLELEVENLEKSVKELQKKGLKLMDADPKTRRGRGVFIHPSSAQGILIYMSQK
ncbi:MAG: VOC family protein [Dehalococcoidales bacterium]|nr:VOC family protein [Dehalococcoidales bacterium]